MYIIYIIENNNKFYYCGGNEFSLLKGNALLITYEKIKDISKRFNLDFIKEKIN